MVKITHAILEPYIQKGLVKKRTSGALSIFNYTQDCQSRQAWDDVTLQCRGLILDENSEIIALPFSKFFNIGEPSCGPLPNLPYRVFSKLDGSLLIGYWWLEAWHFATRGSFDNDYTRYASRFLPLLDNLPKDCTHLFEIILPVELDGLPRLVQHEPGLYYLGARHLATGADFDPVDIYSQCKTSNAEYHATKSVASSLHECESSTGSEGYVIRYTNGVRVKIKSAWYLNLFKSLFNLSERGIRAMWSKNPLSSPLGILTEFPEECWDRVKPLIDDVYDSVKADEARIKAAFDFFYKEGISRKDFAIAAKDCKDKAYLFMLLDKKDILKELYGRG